MYNAPSRSNRAFTDDRTAFDALIRYSKPDGRSGFIAFEVKYNECCTEPAPPIKARYDELSRETGLFLEPDAAHLRMNPLQQLWREHCLAQVMVMNRLYDEETLILIAPRLNRSVQNAAGAYACQLVEPREDRVGFGNWHLEDVVEAIRSAGADDHARQLHRRYCDFWLVDGEIELALDALRAGRKSKHKAAKGRGNKTPASAPCGGVHRRSWPRADKPGAAARLPASPPFPSSSPLEVRSLRRDAIHDNKPQAPWTSTSTSTST